MSVRNFVRLLCLAALCCGCASKPTQVNSRQAIWMTYARNIPHGAQQRESILLAAEPPAVVVIGFPDVQSHVGLGIPIKPLRPGRYIVRASQEGVLKAECSFSVR
jgi:hypothetical protein